MFVRGDDDIGCIPSLQMTINLTDDIPVQRAYASIPKPLKVQGFFICHIIVIQGIIRSEM